MSASSVSTSPRFPWRRRGDLQIVPLEFSRRRSWGVKDPVTLAYFELSDEEHFVLQLLDGSATVGEVCEEFHRAFRPRTLAADELQRFIGQLISQGLLVADGPGYGRQLIARRQQHQSRRRWSRWTNLLCIRFRGIDPDWLLERMLRRLGWLFSPGAIAAGLLLIALAVTLVIVQFDQVLQRLPQTQALLSPPNLLWLPLLLAGVKVLHELGHGLTCKRFGGECRELGAMLLVFTPTLYCNVSDMWMVRDKWKRIAVSAAGMWVEILIASVCTLLWWFSAPGLLNSLCLNLMFLCGVSTFIFNGNPLLRYDGYFVLADWLEIPNLQQQSTGAIRGELAWWFCGIRDPGPMRQPASRTLLLYTYGIASTTYRIVLTGLILWSLHRWLEPYGLGVVVQALAVPMIGLLLLSPLSAGIRFFRSAENRARVDWRRFGVRTLVAGAALVLLLTLPVPSRVTAGALLDQDTAQKVYASLGGILESGVALGDQVQAGQEVARLVDPNVQAELIRVEGELHQHRLRLDQLQLRRVRDPEVAVLIPAVREAMRDFETQLAQLRETAGRLVLRAPCSGFVLPAPWKSGARTQGSLPAWTGFVLDPRNRGCFVQPGTTVCLVGPKESRSALLMVNQDDINLVRVGQTVRMAWNELAGELLTGRVTEIAALDLDLLPQDAIARLNLPARTTADGTVVPVGTWYRVRVQLDATDAPLIRSAVGDARIQVDPQSLGTRIRRWLTRTFPL